MENAVVPSDQERDAVRYAHLRREMRPAMTIKELHSKLKRDASAQRDYIVPIDAMTANVTYDSTRHDGLGNAIPDISLDFKCGDATRGGLLNKISADQVATFTDIPTRYFARLREQNPRLLADNVNHGLAHLQKTDDTKARFVRTIDGKIRAFLSHRYKEMDAHKILDTILPLLVDQQFEVIGCQVTDKRVYLRAATPRIVGEVAKGDVVSYGLQVSTSDVGHGKLKIEPFFLALYCLNGATMESKFRTAHLGASRHENVVAEILSSKTKELNQEAFFATLRDWVGHTMQPQVFQSALEKMRQAANNKIHNPNVAEVVETACEVLDITASEVKRDVLEALVDGASFRGFNQWGLSNAITAAAKATHLDYDESIELEAIGGKVLTLAPSQWQRIAGVH